VRVPSLGLSGKARNKKEGCEARADRLEFDLPPLKDHRAQ